MIMHKLLEIYKTLDDWDLIKTDKGTIRIPYGKVDTELISREEII